MAARRWSVKVPPPLPGQEPPVTEYNGSGVMFTEYPRWTDSQAEALSEDAIFWAFLHYHIESAVELALGRWRDKYAFDYIKGKTDMLEEKWYEEHPDEREEPDPPRKQRIAPALRKEVFERDEYRCKSCGGHKDLTADHIIPESKGGPTELDNLQTLCRPCNSKKGAR